MDEQSISASNSWILPEINRLYRIYNPKKIEQIPKLVEKYGESDLLRQIKNKYIHSPTSAASRTRKTYEELDIPCNRSDFVKKPPSMNNGLICSSIGNRKYAYRAPYNPGAPLNDAVNETHRGRCIDNCKFSHISPNMPNDARHRTRAPGAACDYIGFQERVKGIAIDKYERQFQDTIRRLKSVRAYDETAGETLPSEVLEHIKTLTLKGGNLKKKKYTKKRKSSKKKRKSSKKKRKPSKKKRKPKTKNK